MLKRESSRVNYDTPFTCYKCGKRYTWTDSLTRHLREGCGWLHIKYYGCKNCGKKYKWKDSLIRHHRYVCGKDPQHSCPICGIKIRYKWLLKKHLIDTHEWKIPKGIHI
ncbi:hypothetical protein HZH66_011169 [Vespula vulgaris]|uniref:C2H2-type domain-containing protein n=1 Tax=Vespula vulgaris TaxID=7454 RepID=A0A834MVB0_VESVU|nr:hypothetical protein HZH66_011169 [Vespula vulgaris]